MVISGFFAPAVFRGLLYTNRMRDPDHKRIDNRIRRGLTTADKRSTVEKDMLLPPKTTVFLMDQNSDEVSPGQFLMDQNSDEVSPGQSLAQF